MCVSSIRRPWAALGHSATEKKKTAKVSVHNSDFENFICKKELSWTGCAEHVGQIGSVLQNVVDQ